MEQLCQQQIQKLDNYFYKIDNEVNEAIKIILDQADGYTTLHLKNWEIEIPLISVQKTIR